MSEKRVNDVNIDTTGLRKGERIVHKYDDQNRIIETKKEEIPTKKPSSLMKSFLGGAFSGFIIILIVIIGSAILERINS